MTELEPLNDSSATGESQSIDFSEHWQTILNGKWLVLAITVVGVLGSALHFSKLPNVYTTQAQILVERVEQSPKEMPVPTFRGEEDYYGTQIAILTGRKIAALSLDELPAHARGYLLSARRLKGTRIIALSVTHRDPKMAAAIANKFGEVFVRESTKESMFMAQQMLKLLPEEVEFLKASENVNERDLVDAVGGFSKKEFAESLSTISNDPTVARLRSEKLETQAKMKELSQRYLPGHPSLKEAADRLDFIEKQMKERTVRILSNLRTNYEGKTNITNIRILEEALPPAFPSAPHRTKGVLFHALLSLLAGVGTVLGLDRLNQKVRTEKDMKPAVKLPFLGYVPFAREITRKKDTHGPIGGVSFVDSLRSSNMLADAVASVRTHILFSMPYEKSRKIMFTSTVPNEGKSTVAALVALSLTTLGRKILLIDADLRKPHLHKYLKLEDKVGLADFLVGTAQESDIIRPIEGSTLQFISAGSVSPNPAELLASERFRKLLDDALQTFDRVVIDVPPTLYIPDGLIVAKYVHSGVLVIGSGMVNKKIIQKVVEKFDQVGHAFIGTIINRARYDREPYRYRYYQKYRAYYGAAAKMGWSAFKRKEAV